jgi:hypothetical protein
MIVMMGSWAAGKVSNKEETTSRMSCAGCVSRRSWRETGEEETTVDLEEKSALYK